jgi:hypothetical protein
MYDTAPRNSKRWSAPLLPEGFVPDLQMDDSFRSVGSPPVSPPMLQKSSNSWKLLPIPPMEPDSQGKTMQHSEAKHVKTLINYQHASIHPDTVRVWLPEMGLPPPGALGMPSSGLSPHGRDAVPMTHGHSMQSPSLVSSHRPPSAQVSAARTELRSRRYAKSCAGFQLPLAKTLVPALLSIPLMLLNIFDDCSLRALVVPPLAPSSPVDVHSPSLQAAELKNSVARLLHSNHSGAMSGKSAEDGGVGGVRSASRRVDICGDRGSLKADPARPAFVPALNFPNNINQESDDEDENPGTVVTVSHGGHSSLNDPLLKHQQPQQQSFAHHHENQIPQQTRLPQQGVQHWAGAQSHQGGRNMQINGPVSPDQTKSSNLVSFVNGSTAHSQSLHASKPARHSDGDGTLTEVPASPAIDIHRSLQQSPYGIVCCCLFPAQYLEESVLFIGTQFSNLYTAVDTPARAAWSSFSPSLASSVTPSTLLSIMPVSFLIHLSPVAYSRV